LRDGTQAYFGNSLILAHANGATQGLVDLGDVGTADWIAAGGLGIEHSVFAGTWPTAGQADSQGTLYVEADYFTTGEGNTGNDELGGATEVLLNAFNEAVPSWVPLANSAAAQHAIAPNDPDTASTFFDAGATYRGAFEPGGADWTAGWTAYP
jgi:hypothetical protein